MASAKRWGDMGSALEDIREVLQLECKLFLIQYQVSIITMVESSLGLDANAFLVRYMYSTLLRNRPLSPFPSANHGRPTSIPLSLPLPLPLP